MREILETKSNDLSIGFENGKINSQRSKRITRSQARMIKDGKLFSARFTGEIEKEKLYDNCLKNAAVGRPYDLEMPKSSNLHKDASDLSKLENAEVYGKVDTLLSGLNKDLPHMSFSGRVNRTEIKQHYENSEDSSLSKAYVNFHTGLRIRRLGSPGIIDDFAWYSSFRDLENKTYMNNLREQLDQWDNEVKVQEGPVTVMYDCGFLSKLSESFYANKYYDNSAIYSGKMGEKILSDKLSLYDVKVDPEMTVMNPFDEEGSVANEEKLCLLENGVLRNVISDLKLAKKYGIKNTANSMSGRGRHSTAEFSHLSIAPGTKSSQEIMKDLGTVVYVKLAAGGDFTDKGSFSTPVQLAWLYKDGKVAGRLPQFSINSSVDEMFNTKLVDVSSDSASDTDCSPFLFSEMKLQLY